jgi:CRISPR-associated endonuclease Csn1
MKIYKTPLIGREGPLIKLPHTFPTSIDPNLFCGLDLGIGSCGQALITTAKEKKPIRSFDSLPGPIVFLGVRAFDVPEARDSSGKVILKNPERREKRLQRHTIARRAQRMKKIRRFLIDHQVLPPDYHPSKQEWQDRHETATPWQWRLDALHCCLTPWQWATILLHYAKRRGFKSARKGDIAAKGSEGGTLDSTRANHAALAAYRSVAEMFENDPRFQQTVTSAPSKKHTVPVDRVVKVKRNKGGNYTSMVLRADLIDEIQTVFTRQRELGNSQATEEIKDAYITLLNKQLPIQSGIEKLGTCPFMPPEKRTTPFAPSFELSRALQRLNNITLVHPDGTKELLSAHILASTGYAPFLAAFGSSATISWASLRKLFAIPGHIEFQDIRERNAAKPKKHSRKSAAEARPAAPPLNPATAEKVDFCNRSSKNGCAKGSHLIRNAIGPAAWAKIITSDLTPLDNVAFSLAFYELIEDPDSEDTILGSLTGKSLPHALLAAIRADLTGPSPTLHSFKGACGVSASVCRKLIPYLTTGLTYDKAMEQAGFKHTDTFPLFNEITNPIVKSVIREVMKQVVNLIDEAGALPARIHVEIGRDLGKSIDERNDMDRGIRDRTAEKDANRATVATLKTSPVTDEDLLRYELYIDQGGYCPYSGEPLPKPERIYGPDLQVDHILPRSRSHDNGFHNKVLVYTRANQDKGNHTPYEWLSSSPKKWQKFQAHVLSMKSLHHRKKRNLLTETFATDEAKFAERNLTDTRYISKLVTAYLEALYVEAGHPPPRDKGERRIFTRPGAMTSLVRRAWGLENLKKDLTGKRIGDKHHAVDALVCACIAEDDAQWINRLSKVYGSMELSRDPHLTLQGLETPWPGFRNDVVTALNQITVSRRERCGAGGKLHDETLYRNGGMDEKGKPIALKRISLIAKDGNKLKANFTKAEELDKIAGIHEERSRWLKDALLAWIERGSPIDPTKPELLPRDPQGCLIRKVFVKETKSLREQPQGHVTSGTIVRCDVFSKKGQFHLVPIYKHQIIEKAPPMRAIIAAKLDDNDWTLIDSTFRFEFSLWTNSRFEITYTKGKKVEGCYRGVSRNTAVIAYFPPDRFGEDKDENGKILNPPVSCKTGVASFRKLNVDRLGRKFLVKGEKRTWRGVVCI